MAYAGSKDALNRLRAIQRDADSALVRREAEMAIESAKAYREKSSG